MKGEIDKFGRLWIERAGGVLKEMFCYPSDDRCCDKCPKFGEPEPETDEEYIGDNEWKEFETGRTLLQICDNRALIFDEFEDERNAKPAQNPISAEEMPVTQPETAPEPNNSGNGTVSIGKEENGEKGGFMGEWGRVMEEEQRKLKSGQRIEIPRGYIEFSDRDWSDMQVAKTDKEIIDAVERMTKEYGQRQTGRFRCILLSENDTERDVHYIYPVDGIASGTGND